MEIAALDLADDRTVAACHAVGEEAARADDPVAPPMSARVFRFNLSSGWSGGSFEIWYVPGADGAVAGWYRVEFPDLENLDRALVQLIVHPARRRPRGRGRKESPVLGGPGRSAGQGVRAADRGHPRDRGGPAGTEPGADP